jgi:peptidoglycan-associated lipoprotein
MRVRCSLAVLLLGASMSLVTTGCSKKVAITPPPAPPAQQPTPPQAPTATLSAEPETITAGQAVTLKWSSANATEATISGVGPVEVEGSKQVTPVVSMTFELVASGPGGSARASATVNVMTAPPPLPSAPAPSTPSLQERVNELSDAHFDYDKSNIRDDAQHVLAKDAEELRSILADFPDAEIVLEGHCDERGSAEYNLALGEQRAASASAYLESLGVQTSRVRTISFGKERPQCTEATEACWQSNRRVHFAAAASATN